MNKKIKEEELKGQAEVEEKSKFTSFNNMERKVFNSNDEELGKIEDIILDLTKQRIAFGILSFGGILGMGEKRFAIPWDKLKYERAKGRFILDIDKQTLEEAEAFDEGKYPYSYYAPWANGIYGYWGARPWYL